MKATLTLLVVAIASFAFGQETRKKTIQNSEQQIKEVFTVLKGNEQTKHGAYELYWRDNLFEKGQFENNRKVGVWEFYEFTGKVEQRFNFNDSTLENVKPFSWIKEAHVIENGQDSERVPEQNPCFIGGQSRISRTWKLNYPTEAKRQGASGTVIVSAMITKDGKMIDEKVQKGFGYGSEEAALKAVQNIADEWVPGKIGGKNIDVRILVAVVFRLN